MTTYVLRPWVKKTIGSVFVFLFVLGLTYLPPTDEINLFEHIIATFVLLGCTGLVVLFCLFLTWCFN